MLNLPNNFTHPRHEHMPKSSAECSGTRKSDVWLVWKAEKPERIAAAKDCQIAKKQESKDRFAYRLPKPDGESYETRKIATGLELTTRPASLRQPARWALSNRWQTVRQRKRYFSAGILNVPADISYSTVTDFSVRTEGAISEPAEPYRRSLTVLNPDSAGWQRPRKKKKPGFW